jgi:hypothetical protein
MKRASVGLIIANADDNPDPKPQWVFNIGGRVSPGLNAPESASAKPSTSPATSPSASPTPSEQKTPANISQSPLSPLEDNNSAPNRFRISSKAADDEASSPMQVTGGLIVPLYVIILSVIGGAINMTRRIPKYHEMADISLNEPLKPPKKVRRTVHQVGHVVSLVIRGLTQKSTSENKSADEVSNHDSIRSEKALEGAEQPSSGSEEKRSPDDGIHAAGETREEPETNKMTKVKAEGERAEQKPEGGRQDRENDAGGLKHWQRGLLSQYMYLISAPFLAIATYHLCIWLSLKVVPLFVLVSFSVGLISDQIVEAITDLVGGLLRSGANK